MHAGEILDHTQLSRGSLTLSIGTSSVEVLESVSIPGCKHLISSLNLQPFSTCSAKLHSASLLGEACPSLGRWPLGWVI